jgi:2'-5' RNA ligase
MTDEEKYRTSIAIVMPAYHYGSIDKSHCTVAFLGSTTEVDYTQAQAQRLVDRLGQLDLWKPKYRINTFTTSYTKFGVEQDIPVGILHRDERIFEVRERAEQLMLDYGIDWSKTWEYTPHVTLFPDEKLLSLYNKGFDMNVMLRPPVLWWGNDRPAAKDFKAPFHV